MYSLNPLQNTLWKPSSHAGLILYNKLFLKKKQRGTQSAIYFIQRKAVPLSPPPLCCLSYFNSIWLKCVAFHFKEIWKANSFRNLDLGSQLLTWHMSQFPILPITRGFYSGWVSELFVELLKIADARP